MTIRIPEFERLGLVLDTPLLTRGTLILGGSGSGKSRSAVIPLLYALARTHYTGNRVWTAAPITMSSTASAPEALTPTTRVPDTRSPDPAARPAAMLVIDPKGELGASLRNFAARHGALPLRMLDDPACPPLDYFAVPQREMLDAGAVVDDILALSPTAGETLREPFWRENARLLLKACVELDMALASRARTSRASRFAQHAFWRALQRALQTECHIPPTELAALQATRPMLPRYLALLRLLPRPTSEPARYAAPPGDVLRRVLAVHLPGVSLPALGGLASLASETATSVIGTLMAMIGTLLDPRVSARVCFDPLPSLRTSTRLSMIDAIRGGEILCYRPVDGSAEANIVSRAYKLSYFRATLAGAATSTGRLAAYVCDEWQRVITTGPTGDASFLDVARSHNAVCICASQSLAALRYALGGADDAVRALVANCAVRVQMATTCSLTAYEMQMTVPPPPRPHFPHLISARPLSGLTAGQMLWLTPGKFGMGKVQLEE